MPNTIKVQKWHNERIVYNYARVIITLLHAEQAWMWWEIYKTWKWSGKFYKASKTRAQCWMVIDVYNFPMSQMRSSKETPHSYQHNSCFQNIDSIRTFMIKSQWCQAPYNMTSVIIQRCSHPRSMLINYLYKIASSASQVGNRPRCLI